MAAAMAQERTAGEDGMLMSCGKLCKKCRTDKNGL